jgi:hypothetical protein
MQPMPAIATGRTVLLILCGLTVASLCVASASAFLAGPGVYCGVVVFDRWGNCLLIEGPHIFYISEKVKSDLLPYQNQAMQLDASDIRQSGSHAQYVSILKYKIIGPAPNTHRWATVDGLQLIAANDFGPAAKPRFVVEIRNTGKISIKVDRSQIGIVLLNSAAPDPTTADQVPAALMSGTGIDSASVMDYSRRGSKRTSSGYTVDMKTRPPARFELAPGRLVKTEITFKIGPGQYQFMFGYGGGAQMDEKSVASNAISFELSDGLARLSK